MCLSIYEFKLVLLEIFKNISKVHIHQLFIQYLLKAYYMIGNMLDIYLKTNRWSGK